MTPLLESDALLKRMLFALTDLFAPQPLNRLAYVSGFAVCLVGSAVPPPPTAFALLAASRLGATSRLRADPCPASATWMSSAHYRRGSRASRD